MASGWADWEDEGRTKMVADPAHDVYEPTPQDVQAWRDAAAPLLDAWKADVAAKGHDADAIHEALIGTLKEQRRVVVAPGRESRSGVPELRPMPISRPLRPVIGIMPLVAWLDRLSTADRADRRAVPRRDHRAGVRLGARPLCPRVADPGRVRHRAADARRCHALGLRQRRLPGRAHKGRPRGRTAARAGASRPSMCWRRLSCCCSPVLLARYAARPGRERLRQATSQPSICACCRSGRGWRRSGWACSPRSLPSSSRLVLMLLGFEPSARSMGGAAPE